MKFVFSILFLFCLIGPVSADTKSVVNVAVTQIGKSDQDPKCHQGGCYEGNGREWCSEFVSWVYHEAGASFSGGKHIDWLLNDTGSIQTWFEKYGIYINRQSPTWEIFKPISGDYVFIGRVNAKGVLTERKHSGIVESVDSDGTLHTIEGNNHGQPVARYRYPLYLKNVTDNGPANGIVLGFGHTSVIAP